MARRRQKRQPLAMPSQGDLLATRWNLFGATVQMVSRLRDHIERLDDGIVYAADDLAVVLRALVCPGRGNSVLLRLHGVSNQPPAFVRLSRPAPTDPSVWFAVGSVPIGEPGAMADGAVETSVPIWMSSIVLVVTTSGARRTYTWAQFLNEYANKWGGAHLDEAVPAHLRRIDEFASSGMPLSNYLLRMAGVAVWEAAQQLFRMMLSELGRDTRPAEIHLDLPAQVPSDSSRLIVGAPGANGDHPRDISAFGLLQGFWRRKEEADLLWYVDETSPDNALRLALGSLHWDLRYSNAAVQATQGPVEVRAQRQLDQSTSIDVSDPSVGTCQMNGRIRTLTEVRAS